jgi:AraC-like DNA-binding protein
MRNACGASRDETPPALAEPAAVESRRFFRAGGRRGAGGGWRVVGGGWEMLAAGSYAQRRDFPYWEIEYIAGGRGVAELAGRREALGAGAVYAVGPEMRRGRRSDVRRPLRRHYLWIDGAGAEAALRAAGLGIGRVRLVDVPGEAREVFEWILREGARRGAGAEAVVSHLAKVLLLKLAASREPGAAAAGPGGEETGDASARTSFERCRELIDAEAARLKSTAEIAAAAGLRSETVCRLFKRFLDTTPGDYLRGRRVRLAAERLREPGARVKEVAAALGFADAFHFSRVFRSETGLSPRAWRAQGERRRLETEEGASSEP